LAAFGLGFYIMLHNDIVANGEASEYVFFDSPWLALVKTSTMFIGELEFSDIPVDRDSSGDKKYLSLFVHFVLSNHLGKCSFINYLLIG